MNNPLVSVILPNYNHAPYLDKRIQSILNQTYQDFELIILDDKSPDNSVELMEKYRQHPRVSHIVVNEQNSGSTFIQWNKGFHLAKGEYIWIAESDDYCESTFLERVIGEIRQRPNCAVCFCTSMYVNEYDQELGTYQEYSDPLRVFESHEFICRQMTKGCAIWNASSAVFRKDYALQLDQQYMDYKACGDKLFWIMLSEKGDIIHINEPLNYFRQHKQKVSPKRNLDGTSLKEEYRIYRYLCDKHYLSFFKRMDVLGYYLHRIKTGEFLHEDIRKDLYAYWHEKNVLHRWLIAKIYLIMCYLQQYRK